MSNIDLFSSVTRPRYNEVKTSSISNHAARILSGLKRITLRKVLLKLHLYISLWLGLFLALAGLTCSLLVYDHSLDKWLNAETMQVVPGEQRLPILDLIAAANNASPIKVKPSYIALPEEPDEALIVRYPIKESGKESKVMSHHFQEVMVNPYTGQVLGDRDRNDSFMNIVIRLHANLLVGSNGKLIMGITSLLALILTMTGIYLWWPKFSKLKQALVIKRNASFTRFNFDLHKVVGIYTAIVMFAVCLSGVYFNLPDVFKPVVAYFSPLDGMSGMSAMMGGVKSEKDTGTTLTPEVVMALVEAAYPGIQVQRIFFPANAEDSYRIAARQVDEVRSRGATSIWLDQYSGKFVKIRDPKTFAAGNAFVNLQLPLHNGEILGTPGRLMVLVTGFAPLLLLITGIIHWLKKRKAKRIHNARLSAM